MTWKTSLAVIATSLILAGPAAAQTPGAPPAPGPRGPVMPQTPGAIPNPPGAIPNPPGATTPGSPTPGATTPGSPSINNPSTTNPTFPCPPGQSRRPGSASCIPGPATR